MSLIGSGSSPRKLTATYDYVIVGAGSAGCVLAARLTEDPRVRVLVIEAGGRDSRLAVHIPAAFSRLFKTTCDWNYTTVPQPQLGGRALYWPRGRMLGGTSSMNAQMHVRGNRADYDGWAALGNRGWSYDDVLPYFRRSEHNERGPSRFRGTGGPLTVSDLRDPNPATTAFVEAAVEAGLERSTDVNGERQDGVDYTQVTQRRGTRADIARGLGEDGAVAEPGVGAQCAGGGLRAAGEGEQLGERGCRIGLRGAGPAVAVEHGRFGYRARRHDAGYIAVN